MHSLALVLCALVLVAFVASESRRTYNSINGFWVAGADFLASAKLDKMILYIDGDDGYIIIKDADAFILNEPTPLRLRFTWNPKNWWPSSTCKHFTLSLLKVDPTVLPRSIYCDLYQAENKMVLYTDEIIGILYKDAESTTISNHQAPPPKEDTLENASSSGSALSDSASSDSTSADTAASDDS